MWVPEERVARLEQGLAEAGRTISPHYDDVFREVQQRIAAVRSAGKSDIAILSFWKRLRADTRWVRHLLELADDDIRSVTGPAVMAAREGDPIVAAGQARELLRSLPGFSQGTALASALLTAASPTRLAVYDKRARKALGELDLELANAPVLLRQVHEAHRAVSRRGRGTGASMVTARRRHSALHIGRQMKRTAIAALDRLASKEKSQCLALT